MSLNDLENNMCHNLKGQDHCFLYINIVIVTTFHIYSNLIIEDNIFQSLINTVTWLKSAKEEKGKREC